MNSNQSSFDDHSVVWNLISLSNVSFVVWGCLCCGWYFLGGLNVHVYSQSWDWDNFSCCQNLQFRISNSYQNFPAIRLKINILLHIILVLKLRFKASLEPFKKKKELQLPLVSCFSWRCMSSTGVCFIVWCQLFIFWNISLSYFWCLAVAL